MTLQSAIQKSIKGGWNPEVELGISTPTEKEWKDMIIPHGTMCAVLLNKNFWQALGKELGWKDGIIRMCNECAHEYEGQWLIELHRFVDFLVEGGTIEQFFAELK